MLYYINRFCCPIYLYRNALCKIITHKHKPVDRLDSIYCFNNLREQTTVIAKHKEIKASNKYIEEDLKIPILQGIKNINVQNQINTSMESDVIEFKQELEEAAREQGEEAEKHGKVFKPYVISNNYAITYNKNNIISISILYDEFIGGKHSYIRATYNFNTETGKSLGLKDLFKPNIPYRDLINTEIKKQLITKKNIYPPGAADRFKGIAEDQPFYLEDTNIVLFFGFNEIAPSISEIPIIKINYTAFKNELIPALLS